MASNGDGARPTDFLARLSVAERDAPGTCGGVAGFQGGEHLCTQGDRSRWLDAGRRLAGHLVERSAVAGGRSGELGLSGTHDDLAAWVCTTREAVSRTLAGFRREGWIATLRGRIEIQDLTALRAAAGLARTPDRGGSSVTGITDFGGATADDRAESERRPTRRTQ